ncbi:hypothetical protein ALUC_70628A [Aspergillus luchuensis]|nr:hypothetical protein ALUC_70628A [Aspergillus luchuensis]
MVSIEFHFSSSNLVFGTASRLRLSIDLLPFGHSFCRTRRGPCRNSQWAEKVSGWIQGQKINLRKFGFFVPDNNTHQTQMYHHQFKIETKLYRSLGRFRPVVPDVAAILR